MENEEAQQFFIPQSKHASSHEGFELKSLRSFLICVCVDQSKLWKVALSWSLFFLLAIIVPIVSHILLLCSDCDTEHRRPYDAVVQISLSVFAAISFFSLSSWAHKYGLGRFLFLDKLSDVSDRVRHCYTEELQKSMKFLSFFVFPSFAAEAAYRIWWYTTGAGEIPYLGNMYLSYTVSCTLQLSSWLYRTSIFLLVCIFYQLTCHLQLLCLDEFAQVFQKETEVGSILLEHMKIRRTLRIISHRFRKFLLSSLILVTTSQFISLLMTISSKISTNIYEAIELALCSLSLVAGLFICLRSATKITHKAFSAIGLAAKWHVCATINTFDLNDGETPSSQMVSSQIFPAECDWESEEEGDGDDLDNTTVFPIYASTISFQKRQALVTYLENNRAGITIYGFMVDRTWLHTVFGIELALLLWLLNKTIVNLT